MLASYICIEQYCLDMILVICGIIKAEVQCTVSVINEPRLITLVLPRP